MEVKLADHYLIALSVTPPLPEEEAETPRYRCAVCGPTFVPPVSLKGFGADIDGSYCATCLFRRMVSGAERAEKIEQ